MIGLCTDSNSQIPPTLVEQFGIEVVPLSVVVGGQEYLEGVDLDADLFYRLLADGAGEVSTGAPGPARFVEAYDRLVARGATEIVSVHVSASASTTLNGARLAAAEVGVPVRLVDSSTASFGVTCCVWEAARMLADGASPHSAALRAEAVGALTGNVFVVQTLDLARRGGRLAPTGTADLAPTGTAGGPGPDSGSAQLKKSESVSILTFVDGRMEVIGSAPDLESAAKAMADHVRRFGSNLRVGVGMSDPASGYLAAELAEQIAAAPEVVESVRYRIGPSVGAHTGPGTVGAVYYPT
ncbi:MAG: DegV family protein [Acidimicrobiales bacterium]